MMQRLFSLSRAQALTIAALIAIILLLVGIFTHQGKENTLQSSQFKGVYAAGTDSVLPDYVGQTDDNHDAVQQSFVIFNHDNITSIPASLLSQLPSILQAALSRELPPSSGTTFIQINNSTVACPTEFDCKFSFYIDSPEGYYDFHLTYSSNGTQQYTLKRSMLPGGAS